MRLIKFYIVIVFLLSTGAAQLAIGQPVSTTRGQELLRTYKNVQSAIDYWHGEQNGTTATNMLKYYNKLALTTGDTLSLNWLKFPLASSYHSLTKYDKALPIFEEISEQPNDYNTEENGDILVWLEQEYRAIGDFKEAIYIGQKRRPNYMSSLNDLYKGVGLYDLTGDDYKKKIETINSTTTL